VRYFPDTIFSIDLSGSAQIAANTMSVMAATQLHSGLHHPVWKSR
jgi:hypothetical protein